MVISLVNGGAIVDFRNKLDGSTALHRTVAKSNIESLQTLLDLGKIFFFFLIITHLLKWLLELICRQSK